MTSNNSPSVTIDTPEYRRLRREYESARQVFDRTHADIDFLTMYQIYQKINKLEEVYQLNQIAEIKTRGTF